ncbi:MAG: hypothetical protein GXN98_03330, partial [Euryarchaeota archaeon]|nr:hypothetical protein [Euryarchaeota archaeon]
DTSKNVTVSPVDTIEIGTSQIRNKDGMIKKLDGIRVYRTQIDNVVFVIRPVSKIKDKDGDGSAGEDPKNERDDDGDGKVDEDPYYFYWDYTNWSSNTLEIDVFVVGELRDGQGWKE